MSFVLLKKFLKKLILASFLTIILMAFSLPVASAFSGKDIKDFFSAGDPNAISFTQYSGNLAQLSKDNYDTALTSSTDLKQFVIKIVNFALGFLGLIAVLVVIYGGVLYVTAAGEDEKVGKAKKAIGYAAIGLLIVTGSFAFVNTVIKGATGGGDLAGGGGDSTAFTSSAGFNASAEQIKALAAEIYGGYSFLAEATEDLKNIQNDIAKTSLTPTNFPSKNEMLSFLASVGSKLQTMKSKLPSFSPADASINKALMEVGKEADKVNSFGGNSEIYIKFNGQECTADPDDCADQTDDNDKKVYRTYPEGLYAVWGDKTNGIYYKYNPAVQSDTSFYNTIIKNVSKSYFEDLKRIFAEVEDIYANYSNIEAISGGAASIAHQNMLAVSGYGYAFEAGKKVVTAVTNGFLDQVSKWSITASIDGTGNLMVFGLKQQAALYTELRKLQFVQARLTADTIEGAAPLTVNFNALATVDPAGGSVSGEKIVWDLAGTQTISNLVSGNFVDEKGGKLTGPILTPSDKTAMDCTFSEAGSTDKTKLIGTTAQRCVYAKPGTYTAAIKINSNAPTKFAPGISILTIKVRPPTTKIELSVKAKKSTEPPQIVMHYAGDILLNDVNTVQVTANEAKEGISFFTKTSIGDKNYLTNDVKQFKWDFGDGKTSDYLNTGDTEHKYSQPGRYQVTLEVLSTLGIKDRKIFTLIVSSLAAKIKAIPSSGANINIPVTFDASDSKSDLGKIKNYHWTINPSTSGGLFNFKMPSMFGGSESSALLDVEGENMKSIPFTFKDAGGYDIKVVIKDATGTESEAMIQNYTVKSQPPVAQFEFKLGENKAQPGTVTFDGSKSYDPDGNTNSDGSKSFTYSWTINPATDWALVKSDTNGLTSMNPIIKFKKTGSYEVSLKVIGSPNTKEFSELTKTVKIDNVLDVAWDADQKAVSVLDPTTGKAEIKFLLKNDSDAAKTYEINYGDGETGNGDFADFDTGANSAAHEYIKAGKYTAKITVYDENDKENTISKKIFIGNGKDPIAKARFYINGEEVQELDETINVSKKDKLTFDAIDSRNADGSTKNLKYSWDFCSGEDACTSKNSSKMKALHTYNELSPEGGYSVALSVYDSTDTSKKGEAETFNINVINLPPSYSSISVIPQTVNNTLVTPVKATMKVYGAEDPDGQIVKYKWWYYTDKDPETQYGVQITTSQTANITIGTNGKAGDQVEYLFGLEITDSDGNVYPDTENADLNPQGPGAKLTVTNGANALPAAKFSVNSTTVFTNDEVTFTSSSTDPDGKIEKYIWDFDGDGFFNDEPADEASVKHTYTKMNKVGYDVRLKVIDDNGGESVSEAVKLHVDSLAKPPTAGFTFQSVPGSDGLKIRFTNTSTFDKKAGADILSYQWDYDADSLLATADSNGDGKKDNDTDSQAKDPERLFSGQGVYKVKLTVIDTQGNKDDVVNSVKIPMANPPQVSFTSITKDSQVVFTNTSKGDASSGSVITKNIWDFDTNVDSDGDGKKDNDNDSQLKDPTNVYPKTGMYKAKLTVIDDQGGVGSVVNDVNFNPEIAQPAGTGTTGTGTATGGTSTTGTTGSNGGLKAVLTSLPLPAGDSVIYLDGTTGNIKFDFSKSTGAAQYYIIDKNTNFDTDKDGDPANDQDFKTTLPGTWSTGFDKSWGPITVKLTLTDIYGNKSTATREIKFKVATPAAAGINK